MLKSDGKKCKIRRGDVIVFSRTNKNLDRNLFDTVSARDNSMIIKLYWGHSAKYEDDKIILDTPINKSTMITIVKIISNIAGLNGILQIEETDRAIFFKMVS